MKQFVVPERLTPVDAINCAKYIVESPADKEFIYDFSYMQHCHPFGLLLLGHAIRRNKSHYKKSRHTPIGTDLGQGNAFAADLGFFQYAGWDIGRKTHIEDYGARHIPIKMISISDLQKRRKSTCVLGELVDEYAGELAVTLTQDSMSEATKTLQYCLREMIRNTFEHGKTDAVWVCGQFWPSRSEAEIAIIDEGCGVLASLRTNRRYKIDSDIDANKLALQPGATRMLGIAQDPNDDWQNSGYGLFMASALCGLGGYFILGSGKDATLINTSVQLNYNASIKGTAICMNIRTDSIASLNQELKRLVQVGSMAAKENSNLRVLTASKVSSIASLINRGK